jgi:HlyD family secretion protein
MDNAVMVPATALDTDKSGKSFVKVETNATTQEFKRVNVNVTAKNDTKAAVEGNLAKGDKVMINASQAESADGESN